GENLVPAVIVGHAGEMGAVEQGNDGQGLAMLAEPARELFGEMDGVAGGSAVAASQYLVARPEAGRQSRGHGRQGGQVGRVGAEGLQHGGGFGQGAAHGLLNHLSAHNATSGAHYTVSAGGSLRSGIRHGRNGMTKGIGSEYTIARFCKKTPLGDIAISYPNGYNYSIYPEGDNMEYPIRTTRLLAETLKGWRKTRRLT